MHWSHKATIILLIVAFLLALNYYGVFKAILKQFYAEKIEEEKYVWVDASQYFPKTEIELNGTSITFIYGERHIGGRVYALKKKIPLPCVIIINITKIKFNNPYGFYSIGLVFDKTWKGKIQENEGAEKEVEFIGIWFSSFSGGTSTYYKYEINEKTYYVEVRGLEAKKGIVTIDLTREKIENANIKEVWIDTTQLYIKFKIVKIGFPKQ